MLRNRTALACALCVASVAAHSAEYNVELRVAPEFRHAQTDRALFIPEPYYRFERYQSRQELDLRYTQNGFNALASMRWQVREHAPPDYQGALDEFYVDTALGSHYLSIGKKVMSWGVGYGFRPLDVVQRENRRLPYASTAEGVPLLAWEQFDANHALSVVYANPLRAETGHVRDDQALAARYYQRVGTADIYAVTRISQRNAFEIGAAFSHVVNDALEWHGEWLGQGRYEQRINTLTTQSEATLASDDPVTPQTRAHGTQAVLGFTWTHTSGVALLTEAWYDAAAYSPSQWRDMLALVRRQRALLAQPGIPRAAIYGNIAYNIDYFEAPNLLRENLLLRLSYTGATWSPALDVLYTPADRGVVSTATLRYDGNRQRFELGARWFGGSRGAVYRQIPEDRMVYCLWQHAWS
jgi:hypothetical protein